MSLKGAERNLKGIGRTVKQNLPGPTNLAYGFRETARGIWPLWIFIALMVAASWIFPGPAHGMDHGFSSLPQPHSAEMNWIETRKMPEPPRYSSCCGKGDVYYADIYVRNADGSYEAEITDGSEITFPDGTKRTALRNGTRFHIEARDVNPPEDGNPIGHGVVFLGVSYAVDGYGKIVRVWCFFPLPLGS